MLSRVTCVISVDNRQPCLQVMVVIPHPKHLATKNLEVLIIL
jgi:hypothetical protein